MSSQNIIRSRFPPPTTQVSSQASSPQERWQCSYEHDFVDALGIIVVVTKHDMQELRRETTIVATKIYQGKYLL